MKSPLAAGICGLMLLSITLANVSWLPAYTARVQVQGKSASLPPHLSMALGLGDGMQELAVRQASKRSGQEVRTFNVAQPQKQPVVVLMYYNEATTSMRAFRLKSGGDLDKAVTYVAGGPPQPIPDATARKALREELNVWAVEAGTNKLPHPTLSASLNRRQPRFTQPVRCVQLAAYETQLFGCVDALVGAMEFGSTTGCLRVPWIRVSSCRIRVRQLISSRISPPELGTSR